MARKTGSKRLRVGSAVAVLLCAAFLGWLFYDLWTYEYKNGAPAARNTAGLPRTSLRVGDGTEFCCGPGVWACFTFVNQGQSRLRLVDTPALRPLYDLKLLFRSPDGVLTPVAAFGRAAAKASEFDPDRDAVVVLPPACALTRLIPLSELFDLRRAGQYELVVTYRPGALGGTSLAAAALNVCDRELQGSATFQVPLSPAKSETQDPKPEGNR
ncbi:MAG: hypothetical protein ABSE73_01780 [Planctomycetota bacterium]